MPTPQVTHLTAIVHSCGDPKLLGRLLRGLRHSYPELPVLVACDHEQTEPDQKIASVRITGGLGAGAGRNALLARVKTRYFLLLEDSHQFIRGTKLALLMKPLESCSFDLVLGDVACYSRKFIFRQRVERPPIGTFKISGNQLSLHPLAGTVSGETVPCHLGPNFFIARTDRVRAMGGWDPELKIGASKEFFFRAGQYGLRIGFCPKASIRQCLKQSPLPANHLLSAAMVKMGVTQMTQWDGTVVTAEKSQTARAA